MTNSVNKNQLLMTCLWQVCVKWLASYQQVTSKLQAVIF